MYHNALTVACSIRQQGSIRVSHSCFILSAADLEHDSIKVDAKLLSATFFWDSLPMCMAVQPCAYVMPCFGVAADCVLWTTGHILMCAPQYGDELSLWQYIMLIDSWRCALKSNSTLQPSPIASSKPNAVCLCRICK